MKKLLATMAVLAACGAFAETKTWVGGAEGSWHEGSNWSPAGVPAATDDVLIDGAVQVNWTNGDWAPDATITVSGGARLQQTGGMWPNWGANTHLILDNGTYDADTAEQLRINGGKVTIRNNGALVYTGTLTRSEGSVITLLSGSIPSTMAGNYTLYAADTYADGDFTVTGELQPQDGAVLAGANWTCNLFAPQTANSTITARGGAIKFLSDGNDGFWQSGTTHLDFPKDSTASLTIKSTTANLYAKTFGTTKYTYDGRAITRDEFDALFEVTADGDFATLALLQVSGEAAEFETVTLRSGSTDGTAELYASFTKEGDPAATVYFVWDTEDKGRKLEDWGDNKLELGTADATSPIGMNVGDLPVRTLLHCRLIAVSGEASVATPEQLVFTRHYDVEGTVNEWIGTAGNWSDAANWSLGRAPEGADIVWIEKADAVVNVSGNYAIKPTDRLLKGSLVASGELSITSDLVLEGMNLSCTTFVLNNASTVTMKEGSITTRRTETDGPGGIWPPVDNTAQINFLAGKVASFSFLQHTGAYADTFGRGNFLYNGERLSEEQFNEKFTVATETVTIGEDEYTVCTIATSEITGVPGIKSATVTYAEGTVTVSAIPTDDCATDAVFTFYYDTSDHEHNTSFGWPNQVTLAATETGFGAVLEDLPTNHRYYYLIGAYSPTAGLSAWANGEVVVADLPADKNVWLGKSADAGDAKNWSKGLPTETSVIEINDLFAESTTINWNTARIPSVAGWNQSAAVCVLFDTTKERAFTVTGDVTLTTGANWTHCGPEAERALPANILNVVVTGDMTIGAGATVQAGLGYGTATQRARGYRTCGPGFVDGIDYETQAYGRTFAGDGGYRTSLEEKPNFELSYGSILNPLEWGACAYGDGFNENYAGGGVIKLTVGGTLTVSGTIASEGFGWPTGSSTRGASSGGSINLTAGGLAGDGLIEADGGSDSVSGHGSGGRVAVRLTGEGSVFPESLVIRAFGGTDHHQAGTDIIEGVQDAGAGTVFLKTAADNGRIIVANKRANGGYTHIPALQDGEAKNDLAAVALEVGEFGAVRIVKTVRVKSLTVGGVRIRNGEYTAAKLNELTNSTAFAGEGKLQVGNAGFVVYFR